MRPAALDPSLADRLSDETLKRLGLELLFGREAARPLSVEGTRLPAKAEPVAGPGLPEQSGAPSAMSGDTLCADPGLDSTVESEPHCQAEDPPAHPTPKGKARCHVHIRLRLGAAETSVSISRPLIGLLADQMGSMKDARNLVREFARGAPVGTINRSRHAHEEVSRWLLRYGRVLGARGLAEGATPPSPARGKGAPRSAAPANADSDAPSSQPQSELASVSSQQDQPLTTQEGSCGPVGRGAVLRPRSRGSRRQGELFDFPEPRPLDNSHAGAAR